ncbi:hypothetical protein SDC9_71697 [bioreactor metagenome]|uniref:Uncharacterized protein n=1 Tax=bioreactor metagenome TaxID=1076179 RepID=A0A644YAJ5_9ZZZZ
MKNDIDQLLDSQIEVVQVSIYCDIVKNIIVANRSMSIIKIAVFSFIIKKRTHQNGSIYKGNTKVDLVLKFLSQASGLFEEFCLQMPYIIQAIDLLVKNGVCEVHESEVICSDLSSQNVARFDAFTETAIQESKSYSDRQFLREVISIV